MYQKRIDDMTRNGLITIDDEVVTLTDRGARAARMFGLLRDFLRVDAN
jgi:hypothetical protein